MRFPDTLFAAFSRRSYGRYLLDGGQLREGVDVRDTSRAEIANFNEAAERWFAAVWDLFDAPRSLRSLVDLHDGIPSLVEIRSRKAALM
jgi:hypothetical protein